jgi:uncharacterized damage-inducible protein DinB
MMKMNKLISGQLSACYDKKDWFIPLRTSLKGISVKEAAWKPSENSNSIFELINHLIYWNGRFLKRFKGIDPGPAGIKSNDDTFGKQGETLTAAKLKSRIKALDGVMKELRNHIEKSNDQKLESPVSDKIKYKWYAVLLNINAHNAYHTGQIVLLRKVQKKWKAPSWEVVQKPKKKK